MRLLLNSCCRSSCWMHERIPSIRCFMLTWVMLRVHLYSRTTTRYFPRRTGRRCRVYTGRPRRPIHQRLESTGLDFGRVITYVLLVWPDHLLTTAVQVTDTPQILSGSSLAILDPQHIFSESGGAKFDVNDYPNHEATFNFFPAGGSIIRLPLRRKPSVISKQIVAPQEVQTLFADFIREELDVALLFLKHIKRIEIWHIDEIGNRSCLAGASISKDAVTEPSFVAHVEIDLISSKRWRVFQSAFSQAESATSMRRRLGRDVSQLLEKHKLFPTIAIAVPLSGDEAMTGRLFTYLPLPIRTGFPCHVHSLFALTQSRQNLSNKSEVGIVRGSDDR